MESVGGVKTFCLVSPRPFAGGPFADDKNSSQSKLPPGILRKGSAFKCKAAPARSPKVEQPKVTGSPASVCASPASSASTNLASSSSSTSSSRKGSAKGVAGGLRKGLTFPTEEEPQTHSHIKQHSERLSSGSPLGLVAVGQPVVAKEREAQHSSNHQSQSLAEVSEGQRRAQLRLKHPEDYIYIRCQLLDALAVDFGGYEYIPAMLRIRRSCLPSSFGHSRPLTKEALLEQLQFREISPEDYELLLTLDDALKPKTVPKDLVESLPTEVVEGAAPLEDCCAICIDHFEPGQMLKFLPCGHRFHQECIDEWLLERSTNCPCDGMPVFQQDKEAADSTADKVSDKERM